MVSGNDPNKTDGGINEEDGKDEDGAWEPVFLADRPRIRSSSSNENAPQQQPSQEPPHGRPNADAAASQWSITVGPSRRRRLRGTEAPSSESEPLPFPPNRHIKGALIDRPLQVLGRSFIGHLARELWESDLRFRLAVVCLVACAVSHTLLLSYASAWTTLRAIRPVAALFLLLGAPLLYLHPAVLDAAFAQATAALLSSSPWDWFDRMGGAHVEVRHVRTLFLVVLLLPTLLELYVLHALAQAILTDASWVGIVVPIVTVAGIQAFASRSWGRGHYSLPRERLLSGWWTLLALAWIRSFHPFSGTRLLALSPPLFAGLASGLLQQLMLDDTDNDHEGQGFVSRAVRTALRLALRDAFEDLGSAVQGDDGELLQLAVLRWIVDYWATTTSAPPQTTTTTNASRPSSSHASDRPGPPPSTPAAPPDLSWGELLPMLSVATDRMQLEVQQLHEAHEGAEEEAAAAAAAGPSPSDNDTEAHRRSSTSSSSSYSHTPPPPLQSLQSMLAHMDFDGRAEPAVAAYNRAVLSFPPSTPTAVLWATARRCPALLAVVLGMLGLLSTSPSVHWLAEAFLLAPLVAMELWRLRVWSEHCQAVAPHFSLRLASNDPSPRQAPDDLVPLEMADPMLLLLSDDTITAAHPPTLLRVWRNVRASVPALEAGLTAARCAQTSAAAAEFAVQLRPLVDLGLRINEDGWWYGWSVLLQELLALHAVNARETSSSIPRAAAAPHIDAALQAVGHSRTVARNLRVLATSTNGDGGDPAMDPLWALLAAVVGRGWLWDRQGDSAPASTVTIEEVFDVDGHGDALTAPLVPDGPTNVRGEATDVFSVQLRDHMNASEAEDSLRDQELSRLDRLSEVMETVAACTDQRLLSDPDKNRLYERLANLQSGEQPSQGSLEELETELQALLRPSESLPRHHSSSINAPPAAPLGREAMGRSDGDDASAAADMPPLVAVPTQASFTYECLAAETVEPIPSIWLPPSPIQNQESDLLVVAVPARVEEPCGLDVGKSPFVDTMLTDDHDDDYEPLSSVGTNENARKESDVANEALAMEDTSVGGIPPNHGMCQPLVAHSVVGTSCSLEDDDTNHNNNLLLQLGGGLAVLGAVLGSAAAVAMMQGDRGNSSSHKSEADERRQTH